MLHMDFVHRDKVIEVIEKYFKENTPITYEQIRRSLTYEIGRMDPVTEEDIEEAKRKNYVRRLYNYCNKNISKNKVRTWINDEHCLIINAKVDGGWVNVGFVENSNDYVYVRCELSDSQDHVRASDDDVKLYNDIVEFFYKETCLKLKRMSDKNNQIMESLRDLPLGSEGILPEKCEVCAYRSSAKPPYLCGSCEGFADESH